MIVRHCARCGKELTDAASREAGIGPICRKLDNAALARLIPADVPVARDFAGMISSVYLSELPIEAQPTLFMVLDSLTENESADDWRTTVKRCEWLASWVPEHSMIRTRLTQVIAALGYTALAALWEGHAATGEATAEFRDGRLYLKGPKNKGASLAFKKAMGYGNWAFHYASKEWSCPADKADDFAQVVKSHYLNAKGVDHAVAQAKAYVVAVSKPVEVLPAAAQESTQEPAAIEAPKVVFTKADDYIEIRSPYNGAFIAAVKALPYHDRGWNKFTKCWTVKAVHEPIVRKAVVEAYGCEPVYA